MKIDDYLLGHWSNKFQAQSCPHQYSTVEIEWKKIEGGYHSKNYYREDGPNKPYRERYHKLIVKSETKVQFENYDLDWTKSENCDMIFVFDGNAWHGQLIGDKCTGVRGYRVVSEIHLYGDKLHSMDQGYNAGGEMMWGSELLYKFTRI
ncbi:antenna protein [Synechococcus phage ACG-2014a]|uniref:Antenna protein n=1 Tax=Synechococcus phage ACG-2014a TaxID=1493507 RepID=A0A0E3HFY7_9CAUD|nr:antenna protein [Synechococcus phage ACG-2014a]AIX28149.1 antenna protein [Synechococcus phage ACG-2014a]AIX39531.1 antenna protein [Synechococcus phage ACG-2014a]